VERRLTAILAADVVGYSRLMGDDEVVTLKALKKHKAELIDPKAAQYNGRIIKLMGDGVLMEFGSVVDAVSFAVEVQSAMQDRNADLPDRCKIIYRIGINTGDVLVEGEDIYGDGVNVAARLESLAKPGGICVARYVHDQVRNKLDLDFEDLGEVEVKNISRPVRASTVVMNDRARALQTPTLVPAAKPLPSRRSALLAVTVLALLMGILAVVWWRPWDVSGKDAKETSAPLARMDKPSVAVLPFNNMSDDKSQDYFADGIAEDVITDLSKLSGLFVIARNSSFRFRGQALDLVDVGRQLGVKYILEGSVRKSGGRVRINAQLIDARTGGHVWAERYDGDLSDVFLLQDKVAGHIIEALKVQITPSEKVNVQERGTKNPAAYDAYLRGLRYLASGKRLDVEGNRAAQKAFEEAIKLDPNYALAVAGLAWAKWLYLTTIYVYGSTDDLLRLAEKSLSMKDNALARRALSRKYFALESEFVPTKREPHAAVAELERAKELQPNNPDILADLAKALSFAGRPKEALRLVQRAMELNPDHPSWYFGASGIALLLTGYYERSVTHLKKWSSSVPAWRLPYIFIAAALAGSGEIEAAKSAVSRFNDLYSAGSKTTLYALRFKWPMDEDEQQLFDKNLRLAGVN
jgi:adenylate cyclase